MIFTACAGDFRPCFADSQMVWDGKKWVHKTVESGTTQGDLSYIQKLIHSGRFKQAVKEADLFLKNYPGTPACEEAMNLAGQALLHDGEYWKAYHRFEDQIAAYPNGAFFERALDREYKIGDAFLQGRKRRALKILKIHAYEEGVDILMRISTQAPNSEVAQRSLLRVADYYFDKKDYADAIRIYDDFEKQYPRSRRRPYAMFQAAQSYLLSYKGIKWDETPLIDARKKYEVFAAAYPKLAKDKNIPEILKNINEARAHKIYHTGEFYRRTHKRKAAVFYYEKTINEFPATDWAGMAKLRLDEMGPASFATALTGKTAPARTDDIGFIPAQQQESQAPRKEIIPIPEMPTVEDAQEPKIKSPTPSVPTVAGPRIEENTTTTVGKNDITTGQEIERVSQETQGAMDEQDDSLAPIRLEDLMKKKKAGTNNQ